FLHPLFARQTKCVCWIAWGPSAEQEHIEISTLLGQAETFALARKILRNHTAAKRPKLTSGDRLSSSQKRSVGGIFTGAMPWATRFIDRRLCQILGDRPWRSIFPGRCAVGVVIRESHRSYPTLGRSLG